MTRAARIAWGLVAAAMIGWGVSIALAEVWWVVILRHACEGAFVGGICDAFAIWKVYTKVETRFEDLTEEVAGTVIDDMIKPEEVVSRLQARLHEPDFARQLMARVETLMPSEDAVRTFLADAWEQTLRERLVAVLSELDASDALARLEQRQGEDAIHHDPVLREGIHRCLRHAAADPDLSLRLYQGIIAQFGDRKAFEIPALPPIKRQPTPVTLEQVIPRLLDPETLHHRLVEGVERLMAPAEGAEEAPLRGVMLDYAHRYSDGWVQLSPDERRAFVSRLVDRVVPPLIDGVAAEIWTRRNTLQRIVAEDLPLNTLPVIDYISTEVERLLSENLSALDARSTDLLVDRLRAQTPREFRDMLERRTRPELDWIQVNGAGLGLLLGTIAGVLGVLLGH